MRSQKGRLVLSFKAHKRLRLLQIAQVQSLRFRQRLLQKSQQVN